MSNQDKKIFIGEINDNYVLTLESNKTPYSSPEEPVNKVERLSEQVLLIKNVPPSWHNLK